jgi:CMP/dCMP kinase
LVAVQRRLAANTHLVTEGRDQGTVAFPDAHCKIFLTASATERARRRAREMRARGELIALDDVLAQQNERDHLDRTRTVGPLVPATDAIVVHTDGLDLEQVVDRIETLVREQCRLGHRGQSARPPDPAGGAPRSRSGE